ncbi:Imm7 family immunity protein [Streptomyces sparsogenes]|uniref:Imm7 family immunity protein n=1 Tax=Streptomyces sparsogenes TaxID=67365 RepID=UPI0033F18CD6
MTTSRTSTGIWGRARRPKTSRQWDGWSRFHNHVESLGDAHLLHPLGPISGGPYAHESYLQLALHALDKAAHHGAELDLLRDLYLQLHHGAPGDPLDDLTLARLLTRSLITIYGLSIGESAVDDDDEVRLRQIVDELRLRIAQMASPCLLDLRWMNGEPFIHLGGHSNHRSAPDVVGLLEHVAAVAPGSYGLLHMRDDEDPGHENEVRVLRLVHSHAARGGAAVSVRPDAGRPLH